MRRPAMKRSPKTEEELKKLVLWAVGPRVEIRFDFEGIWPASACSKAKEIIVARLYLDGKKLTKQDGLISNGCQVGESRHTSFWGQGWMNFLNEVPIRPLWTPEAKAYWSET